MTDAVLQILIVEDEPAHAEAIRRELLRVLPDIEVRVASSLRDYHAAIDARRPDIVLFDWLLPDGRAIEVLTSPPESGPFPILVMTSHGDEQIAVEALKAGALDYVVKSPTAFAEMPHTISRALREWKELIDRKSAEEALHESEERFRQVAETAGEWIWEVDASGLYTYSSPLIERILGYKPEEIVGKKHFYDLFRPEDGEALKSEALAAFADKRPFYGFLNPSLDKKGQIRWLSTTGLPILDATGNLCGYRGSDSDVTERKRAEERLQETLQSLRQAITSTIRVLSHAVEARDPYTAGHQRRVTFLAEAIAVELGLPPEKIECLHMAGLVHDIGKISIPAEILSKPSTLTRPEYALLKTHVQKGYEILKSVDFPWPLAEIVHQHHERMDGSGYPQGLRGDEIFVESRILAVADTMEAMSSHRPYRPALGMEVALGEIERDNGGTYDPKVVAACLELFRKKGFRFPD